jgi:hypothetical protein
MILNLGRNVNLGARNRIELMINCQLAYRELDEQVGYRHHKCRFPTDVISIKDRDRDWTITVGYADCA